MAERLKLRDQTDVELPAQRCESSRAIVRYRICSSSEFRVRVEREVVVDLENYHVNSEHREVSQILAERIQRTISVVVQRVYGPPGFGLLGFDTGLSRRPADVDQK